MQPHLDMLPEQSSLPGRQQAQASFVRGPRAGAVLPFQALFRQYQIG
jgi:hypothetical protein